ncbi:MAG TPA: RecX family transcriptional regulator [Alphaproteobacteria bacterium]|jgi:regulatory protein|nr:RecX family transcriptional regulator [Alphaproteobacteria bacterium]
MDGPADGQGTAHPARARGASRRGPRRATAQHLEDAALHYLERFASSATHLRRVLMRRVERSARIHGTDRAEGAALVEDLLGRFERSGLLDDRVYAEGRAAALFRRGTAPRAIRAALRAKGVASETIEAALGTLGAGADAELTAAAALARRRRLGPYRPAEARAGRRDKDLAALARAGFGYDVARRVIDAEDRAELEAADD